MLFSIIRMFKKTTLSYSEVYKQYYQDVYRVAYFMTKDPHISYDVAQDTFYKAYQYMDSLEESDKMKSWLCSIATRTSLDYLRRKREICIDSAEIEDKLDPDEISVEEIVENNYLKELLLVAIDGLDEKYKQVVIMKYFTHLNDAEIAKLLGLSKSTIKSRIYRAKAILKKSIVWRKEGIQ